MTQVTQLVITQPLMRQARNLQLAIIDLAKKRDLKPEQFRAHLNAIDMLAREAHNLFKAPLDSLTQAGVIADDSLIDDVRMVRCEVVKGGRLEIIITEMEAA